MSFACIDFETANRKRSSACRLGIAIVSEGAIQRSESWLIRPTPFEFEPINISKHGITVEQVNGCPNFSDLWEEIQAFIGNARLVAHNAASFDMNVLRQTLTAYSLPVPDYEYLCTLQIAKTLWQYPSNSLPFLASVFGIQLKHHDALSDSLACAHVLLRAMVEIGTADDAAFIERLSMTPGVLQSPWGHASPYSHVTRNAPKSISEFFSGQLADLRGRTVSTTGTLGRGINRDHFQQLVVAAGGEFHEMPKQSTQLFVLGTVDVQKLATGESQTKKHRTALELFNSGSGIEIISADDFVEMLFIDGSGDADPEPPIRSDDQ